MAYMPICIASYSETTKGMPVEASKSVSGYISLHKYAMIAKAKKCSDKCELRSIKLIK